MFVSRVLEALESAPVVQRERIASVFAECYLTGVIDDAEKPVAEGILFQFAEDPSPLVRKALAYAVCHDPMTPRLLVHHLARDSLSVAEPILKYSPVLCERELIELVEKRCDLCRLFIALRPHVPYAVTEVFCEQANAHGCATLLDNAGAEITMNALFTLTERHADDARVRDILLERDDLPLYLRHRIVAAIGQSLRGFAVARYGMNDNRIAEVVTDATEKATVALIEMRDREDVRQFLEKLLDRGELTPQLILRALCCGNALALEQGLSLLTGQSQDRVFAILMQGPGSAFKLLYKSAGFPERLQVLFETGLKVFLELCGETVFDEPYRFRRAMIERVLTDYERIAESDLDPLVSLLMRYAADTAKEESRRAVEMFANAA